MMSAKERIVDIGKKIEPLARVATVGLALGGSIVACKIIDASEKEPTAVVRTSSELEIDKLPTIYHEVTYTQTATVTPSPTHTPTLEPILVPPPNEPASVNEYVPPYGTEEYKAVLADAINFWCAQYAVSCVEMECLVSKESTYGLDPSAFDGTSDHLGPFQFDPDTWDDTPPGLRGEDPNNPWAAAEGAAWMISVGRRLEWPTCR